MSELYPDLNLTIFPKNVDTFIQWLDITANDGPLIKQYAQAIEKGDTITANQILSQIPSGTQKIIKASDLNKLTQSILAIERFYKTDIESYINDKQEEWESILNQFVYKGVWSSGTPYIKNNMVSYASFGIEYVYIAIKDVPFGKPVSDKNYWRLLTIQGQQGVSGTGLSYREEWNVSVAYGVDDAVTYSGALWMAIKPSHGIEPVQGSDIWKKIMSLRATTYPIQDNQPQNQEAGELWFNTQGDPIDFYFLKPLKNLATSNDIIKGKEAYSDTGERILGTGTAGAVIWNSDSSSLSWN